MRDVFHPMYSTSSFQTFIRITAVACMCVPAHAIIPMVPLIPHAKWTIATGPHPGTSLHAAVSAAFPSTTQYADSTSLRLTVRPRTMATGTQTAQAGWHAVPNLPDYSVYVPASAVGTRRVPLVVLLHPAGGSGEESIHQVQPLADQYGVIVLAPSSTGRGLWDLATWWRQGERTTSGIRVPATLQSVDVPKIDYALRHVLQTFAIDPARIALMGFSDGGSVALLLGRANLDIFSRIVGLSALIPYDGNGVTNPATQFLLAGGLEEPMVPMVPQTLKLAQVLRHASNPVVTLLGMRAHTLVDAEEDFALHWLVQSWADSASTAHANARALASAAADPVLTRDVVKRMTTFWARFIQEPDYIVTEARLGHQVPRWFTIGTEPVLVLMTDMPALAVQYPSVAADLQAAGLTAPQEEAYRLAMFRALCAREAEKALNGPNSMELGKNIPFPPIAPNSVLGKNIAALQAYQAEFSALDKTGIWTTP